MSVHITKFNKTTSWCGQCFATDRATTDVPTTSISMDTDMAVHFRDAVNMMQAPVVIVRDTDSAEIVDIWSGFQPDKINKYKDEAVAVPEEDERFRAVPESNPLGQVAVAV